ncbi:MAG: hypothetical protein IPM96_17875 [Ignavibacteria bacterium]|nr:hypothetical protein [Ignavibacteria bacterium]
MDLENLFNNTLHEAARGMTFDAQGNIYFLSEILNSFTTSSMAVTKLQTSSAVIWEKIYGTGNEKINPADIKTDNSNNVIVICGRQNSANNNKFDAVTLKYNSAGDTVWTKRLKGFGNNDVKPFGLNLDNDQFIYITGQYPLQSSGTHIFKSIPLREIRSGILMFRE